MIVVTNETIMQWQSQDIVSTVSNWFNTNSGKHVSDCVAALNLTTQQVWWALYQNPMKFTLLPEADAEAVLVAQIDRTMHGS